MWRVFWNHCFYLHVPFPSSHDKASKCAFLNFLLLLSFISAFMVNKNVLVHISFKDACEVHAHACYKRNVSHANEEKTCCAYHKSTLMVLNSETAPFTENLMVIDDNFIELHSSKEFLMNDRVVVHLFHFNHNWAKMPFFSSACHNWTFFTSKFNRKCKNVKSYAAMTFSSESCARLRTFKFEISHLTVSGQGHIM